MIAPSNEKIWVFTRQREAKAMKRLLLAVAVAIAMPVGASVFAADDTMAISNQINQEWVTGYNTGKSTELTKLYTSTAVLVPPDAKAPISGDKAIDGYFQQMFKGPKLENFAIDTTNVKMINDAAFTAQGTWSADIGKQHAAGLWMDVVQKEGSDWKIGADTWNMPPPPPPKEAAASATTGSGSTTPNKQ
jgi:ketosteroid isomerase-like protein